MVHRKLKNGWLLRLEKGEELVAVLNQFCHDQKVEAGWLNGLGGCLKARLGYYNLTRKKYIFRAVKDARELVSLQGTVAMVGDQMALHIHGVVTDGHNKAYGGHIKELYVGGTCEVMIQTFEGKLERALDSEIGLPLLQL